MLMQLETPARTVNGKKVRHRRASVLLQVLIGAITAIVSFAAPVHAATAGEDCTAQAAVLVAALKQTVVWQAFTLSGRAPELTEAEFVKVCEDLPPSDGFIEAVERRMMAFPGQEKREIVPFDAIPERVRKAFVAAEDPDFYRRGNVGFAECAKRAVLSMNVAIVQRAQAERQNAPFSPYGNFFCYSGFSWGLARNLLAGSDMSIKRKFKEMLAAGRIEAALDKSRILQLYLNQIYLGRNAFGIAAAAQRYFGKRLSELTVEEAAYLAGLPKEPSHLDAARNYPKALERRDWVIGQMAKCGYITRQEAEAAAARPLTVIALSR
jgi:penicillin-binding protein 1A